MSIPAGLKALNGTKLSDRHFFTFITPALKVLTHSLVGSKTGYRQYTRTIDYNQGFKLVYNYPASIEDLEKHLTLRSGGTPHPGKLVYARNENEEEGDTFDREAAYRGSRKGSTSFTDFTDWDLKPGVSCTIAIAKNLKDIYSNGIKGETAFTAVMPSYRPSISADWGNWSIEARTGMEISHFSYFRKNTPTGIALEFINRHNLLPAYYFNIC